MEGVSVRGIGKWEAIKDGKVYASGSMSNQIKNLGKAEIAKLLGYGLAGVPFRYIAVGSGSTANDPLQTALVAEISTGGLQRMAATVSSTSTVLAGDTARFYGSWTLTSDATIQEVGIFNGTPSGSGVLLGRLVTGAISLLNGSVFNFTYDIIVG